MMQADTYLSNAVQKIAVVLQYISNQLNCASDRITEGDIGT